MTLLDVMKIAIEQYWGFMKAAPIYGVTLTLGLVFLVLSFVKSLFFRLHPLPAAPASTVDEDEDEDEDDAEELEDAEVVTVEEPTRRKTQPPTRLDRILNADD